MRIVRVDDEFGIEDLVPAVLGVGLREHHELDIGRVASERAERLDQIVDLIARQRQPELRIGAGKCGMTVAPERHHLERPRRRDMKQVRLERVGPERLGHSIVHKGAERAQLGLSQRLLRLDDVARAALQAPHGREPAHVGDIGGLARPGGHRAQPRRDEQSLPALLLQVRPRPVRQELAEELLLGFVQRTRGIHEMHETRPKRANARVDALQRLQQSFEAKLRQRGRAGQTEHAKF